MKMPITGREFKVRLLNNVILVSITDATVKLAYKKGDIINACYMKKPIDGLYFKHDGKEYQLGLDEFELVKGEK